MKFRWLDKKVQLFQFAAAVSAAFIGGLLFSLLQWPIPWLLGPMSAVLIVSRIKRVTLYWPTEIRNAGLIIVGYSIGLTFTKDTLITISSKLPSMALMTVLLVLICMGMAFIISKLSSIDFPTALTSSIPGGLSQIITFAEESKGIDITTVTFFQVTRLLMIIFFVPFLIFSPLFLENGTKFPSSETAAHLAPYDYHLLPTLFFIVFSIAVALIGKRIKLPTAFLLAPILGIAILNVAGYTGPPVPSFLLDISQFMIGGYIGLLLKPEQLKSKAIIPVALFSGIMLVCISLGLSYLLSLQYRFSPLTSFLSLAPGGADQMGIIGHELHADISMITGYQLFRILFIFFAVPPLLKYVLRFSQRKSENKGM
ncbi:AbrB family transcriptional regulator [Bacillus sp. NEB1478]|uniref:AbrB family transcriptional regulator n=1 Tax=Bacillus sp. NEB1478 TaxID=3073816 RepID=UPI00287381B2|nr:AbrB family transcriptional regulator [Bacillus sp. NEB1478]WNB93866.1 AbrB family transcriptional regulator [Bacillus sp. NEB1478]